MSAGSFTSTDSSAEQRKREPSDKNTQSLTRPVSATMVGQLSASITNVNKVYSLSQFGMQNSGGSVQLTDDAVSATTIVDVVGYGTVAAMATTDPKQTTEGTSATIPASGSTGKTIGRKAVPGDSNNNSTDFCVMNQTPGAANGSCL